MFLYFPGVPCIFGVLTCDTLEQVYVALTQIMKFLLSIISMWNKSFNFPKQIILFVVEIRVEAHRFLVYPTALIGTKEKKVIILVSPTKKEDAQHTRSFYNSKPFPSNLLSSKRFFTSAEVKAIDPKIYDRCRQKLSRIPIGKGLKGIEKYCVFC